MKSKRVLLVFPRLKGKSLSHQAACNKAFEVEFAKRGWELQAVIAATTVGQQADVRKNDVLVEVQFGNNIS